MNSQMLRSIFTKGENETLFQIVYFWCICIMVISLPNSIYFVSVAQILMAINWLSEGQFREKMNRYFSNRPALILSSVYLIYVAGIFWTSNLSYGIGYDLKNKLPLLTLTFVFASSRPLPLCRLNALLVMFVLGVLATTFIGFGVYLGSEFVNPRKLSPFISHIYVSMMLVLSIFLLPWTVMRMNLNRKWVWISLGISAWLLISLFTLGSMTSIFSLAAVIAFLLLRQAYIAPLAWQNVFFGSILFFGLAASVALAWYVAKPVASAINPDEASLSETTSLGNHYSHDFSNNQRENGHFVNFFIAENELREAWNERSKLNFDSLDFVGQELRVTLLRYLSSKGLRKDRDGLSTLDSNDIAAIENGVANYLYVQWPNVMVRLHQTFWEINEYARTGNPTGHSFSQRLELWRASLVAFIKYPVFGWGTGDVFEAIEHGLQQINSPLENYKMKPHSQPLIILLMLGATGLILFFGLIFVFVKISKAYRFLPFNIMLVIVCVAMFGNNLIDFQIGLTFFLFFSLFFGIFSRNHNFHDKASDS